MRSSREEKADGDGVDVGGNDDDEEKKLWLTLRLRVELAYEPDLPEKLNFQVVVLYYSIIMLIIIAIHTIVRIIMINTMIIMEL